MTDLTFPAGRGTSPAAALAVLIVDDQAAVRAGLSRLVHCAALPLRAVSTAGSGAEALQVAAWLQPELVLLDADLAGEDGLALIPALAPAAVLVLTCHGDRATRERAARLGAGAFVQKHQPAAELLQALVLLAARQTRGDEAPTPQGATTPQPSVASSAALRVEHP